MQARLCCLIFLLSMSFFAFADETEFAGQTKMNGYSLSDFGDFVKEWKLVTVRYREDTKEMRFTYANKIAAEALEKESKDYPEGAVFAKIGFVSEKDPAFVSSVVPSGAKRYQFMVRDKKKFSSTDGWGYVLLNGDGKTFNGDPKKNSQACAACHHIVPERGYVFSQPASFSPFVEKQKVTKKAEAPVLDRARVSFKTEKVSSLSANVRRLLPGGSSVRLLQGPLREHAFEGTVNEIGPLLVEESRSSHLPAALVSPDARIFAFAFQDHGNPACTVVGRSVTSNQSSDPDQVIVKYSSLCEKR